MSIIQIKSDFLEYQFTKKFRSVKVRFGIVNWSPGQPVWMRSVVGDLVKVGAPDNAGSRSAHLVVLFEHVDRYSVFDCPRRRFGDFRIHDFRHGVRDFHPPDVRNVDGCPVLPGDLLKMKQGRSPAVYFDVEIAQRYIVAGREEELNTTVFPDGTVIFLGHRPDIAVFHSLNWRQLSLITQLQI